MYLSWLVILSLIMEGGNEQLRHWERTVVSTAELHETWEINKKVIILQLYK